MMVPENENMKFLTIALFPRDTIVADTYLRDFLIHQYYLLNYHLLKTDVLLNFKVILGSKFRQTQYANAIKLLSITKPFSDLDKDVNEFYGETDSVHLDKFNVSAEYLDFKL